MNKSDYVEGHDPNDDGWLCPNCGHHRTWPPVLTCLIVAPGFHRHRAELGRARTESTGDELNPLAPEAIAKCAQSFGVVVWRSWRNNMLKQGREVAEKRMRWDTLPQQDKDLDCQIYEDVARHFAKWLMGQLTSDAESDRP